jgi:hypothetical protein
MRTNASQNIQVFYRRDGEPVEVFPGFSLDESLITSPGAPCLRAGFSLDEQLRRKPDSSICFCRTYALGDILVLTPIFSSLKDKSPDCKIYFATAPIYKDIFKYWDSVRMVGKESLRNKTYDIGFYLDGVVEKDHSGNRFSHMHRLDIYCDSVGWPVPKEPIFSLPFSDKEKEWAEGITKAARLKGNPVAVMQLSGAMWFNHFEPKKTMEIAAGVAEVCSLVMIHNYRQDIKIKGVTNLTGRTTFHELAALIDSADVAITMDSGVLWVAHCTKTPIIAMFGHTRAKEKMTHHRNYHAIDLATMVGCESCFGRQIRCKGKVNCLNKSDTGTIIEEIRRGIKKLIYGKSDMN